MASVPDQDRVALAKIVIAHREHVNALEPLGKGILGTSCDTIMKAATKRIAFLTCRRAAQPARPWFSVRGVQPFLRGGRVAVEMDGIMGDAGIQRRN